MRNFMRLIKDTIPLIEDVHAALVWESVRVTKPGAVVAAVMSISMRTTHNGVS